MAAVPHPADHMEGRRPPAVVGGCHGRGGYRRAGGELLGRPAGRRGGTGPAAGAACGVPGARPADQTAVLPGPLVVTWRAGAGANRSLASLSPGGRGRISELRLEDSARLTLASPLHPGVDVQVLVDPDQGEGAATASDAYTVLVSRAGRANWLVRVIARASATVALSEQFSSEPAARDRFEELRADADRLDAAAFRSLHELP